MTAAGFSGPGRRGRRGRRFRRRSTSSEMPSRRGSQPRFSIFSAAAGRGRTGLAGYCAAMSRPIISCTISPVERAPLSKVSMWRPLRNTDARSAKASTSCMRWVM